MTLTSAHQDGGSRIEGGRGVDGIRMSGPWAEMRRALEEMGARALTPGRMARVRAAFPWGAGGATILFESGEPDSLARGTVDPHRPAAILDREPAAADFCASLYFPESDPELEPLGALLAGDIAVEGRRPVMASLRSYRPLRRAQVELHFSGESSTAFAKIEHPRRARRAARRRAALERELTGELRLPPTIAEEREIGVTIASAAPGAPLSEALVSSRSGVALARVGRALIDLERALGDELASLLPAYGMGEALADLVRFGALVDRFGFEVASTIERGIERLRTLSPDSGRRAVLHRDLHDGQLVLGRHVVIFDLDQASAGDPAVDVGNLLAHLRLRALQGRLGATSTAAGRALLSGHGAEWAGRWRQSVLIWEAASLFRLAAVYALRPRWSYLGSELASMAERILDAPDLSWT